MSGKRSFLSKKAIAAGILSVLTAATANGHMISSTSSNGLINNAVVSNGLLGDLFLFPSDSTSGRMNIAAHGSHYSHSSHGSHQSHSSHYSSSY